MKRIAKGGLEIDAFGPVKRHLNWKTGERKAIKVQANRRERRQGRQTGWASE